MKKFNLVFRVICYGVAVLGAICAITQGNDGYLFPTIITLILSETVTFQKDTK